MVRARELPQLPGLDLGSQGVKRKRDLPTDSEILSPMARNSVDGSGAMKVYTNAHCLTFGQEEEQLSN
jgi:hypothetical protein